MAKTKIVIGEKRAKHSLNWSRGLNDAFANAVRVARMEEVSHANSIGVEIERVAHIRAGSTTAASPESTAPD